MAYDDDLVPATTLAQNASHPYPNDSADYRAARTALLAEEIELRRQTERVAALRRALPPGGEVPEDYVFIGEDGQSVRLSELFGDKTTLVVYTWMFGPQRKRPCPMCTAFLGSLDGEARDIEQQVPLIIVGKAPIDRQLDFKTERGWTGLRFVSSGDNAYTRDYRGEGPDGEDWAAFNVFTKDPDGTVRHFWGGEMDGSTADPGQDPRGAPEVMPMWTIFDMTPEGRAPNWYPKLAYPEDPKA
jgi:predicted dithiol-disulfide oxidoreductase (DUF899 family)